MRTAQERFFDDLDELAKAHRHELTVQYDYSNTGRATLTPEGSYQPTATFYFQFSLGHNVFRSADLFPERPSGSFLAKDLKGIGEMLDYVEAALP